MTEPVAVLVVDDDHQAADLAETMLERERNGLSVTAVTTADRALEVLDREPIDCIVSDYEMPAMSGLELLEHVRERDDRLPFILFTGRGSEEVASEAIAAGVTQYLQKQGGREQYTLLANQISNAVERYRTETTLREREEWYRRTLAALHGGSRRLMRAETREAVHRAVVETAREVLEARAVAVYGYAGAAGRLELSETGGEGAVADRFPPTVEEGPLWETFSTGESVVEETEVIAPLGGEGVLVVDRELVDRDATVELVNVLAANTEAALDRAEREELLRERDRALERQNEELTRLDRVNGIVREINRAVTSATTREEIETTVCERLAETERYRGAWIAQADTDPPTPRAWAGLDGAYLDAVRADGPEAPEVALIEASLGSGDPAVVENVLEDERWTDRRRAAVTGGFQTVLAVPVLGGDRRFGTLLVHVAGPHGVDEKERSVLAELAETVGYAIRSIERTRSMVTDNRLEIELRCPDPRFVLNELAAAAADAITLEGVLTRADASPVLFVRLQGEPPSALTSLPERRETIESVSVLSTGETGSIVEVTVSAVPLLDVLAEFDARLSMARAGDGATLVLSLSAAVEPRSVVEAIRQLHPDTELVARREDETRPPVRGLDAHLESALTDRQREALQAAHYGGYFEWPRDTTGESLAGTLDVSPPTYHYHLRAAQRKLVGLVFDETYKQLEYTSE